MNAVILKRNGVSYPQRLPKSLFISKLFVSSSTTSFAFANSISPL